MSAAATENSDPSQSGLFPCARVANSFFVAPAELSQAVQFGFVLGSYRRKSKMAIQRLPSARATIYYAADIRTSSGARNEAGLFCEGPRTHVWEVGAECGEVIGFRLRAGAVGSLLGHAAREIRDRTIPLEHAWGSEASALLERMHSAASPKERRDLLARALMHRYCQRTDADDCASVVARAIEHAHGRTPIAFVAERANLRQRMLLRKFDESVGVTPKQYARVVRLRSTLAQLAEVRGDLARLALDRGFCDQAHMIHEFQDLVGCAPASLADQRLRFGPAAAPSLGFTALPNCERQLYPWLGPVSFWLDRARRLHSSANSSG